MAPASTQLSRQESGSHFRHFLSIHSPHRPVLCVLLSVCTGLLPVCLPCSHHRLLSSRGPFDGPLVGLPPACVEPLLPLSQRVICAWIPPAETLLWCPLQLESGFLVCSVVLCDAGPAALSLRSICAALPFQFLLGAAIFSGPPPGLLSPGPHSRLNSSAPT